MPGASDEAEVEGMWLSIVVVNPDGPTNGILMCMLLAGSSRLARWCWVSLSLLLCRKSSQSSGL